MQNPMQSLEMTPSSKGHHNGSSDEDDEEEKGEGEEEREGEVDNVIQDYIDQVAATNLKQRRTSFAEMSELPALAIPDNSRFSSVSGPVSTTSPGNPTPRSRGTTRFSPATSDSSSMPTTPRSALKKGSQIPEPPPASEQLQGELAACIHLDNDIENQKDQTIKSEKELIQAKKLLRLAFVEFYRGLSLLSNYRYTCGSAEDDISCTFAV